MYHPNKMKVKKRCSLQKMSNYIFFNLLVFLLYMTYNYEKIGWLSLHQRPLAKNSAFCTNSNNGPLKVIYGSNDVIYSKYVCMLGQSGILVTGTMYLFMYYCQLITLYFNVHFSLFCFMVCNIFFL